MICDHFQTANRDHMIFNRDFWMWSDLKKKVVFSGLIKNLEEIKTRPEQRIQNGKLHGLRYVVKQC